jgi:hypothetical protein
MGRFIKRDPKQAWGQTEKRHYGELTMELKAAANWRNSAGFGPIRCQGYVVIA